MGFTVRSVLVALYLRGFDDAPAHGLKSNSATAVEQALRRANASLEIAAEILRRAGFRSEAAVLEIPGRLARAEALVRTGRVLVRGDTWYPRAWEYWLGDAAPPALWMEGAGLKAWDRNAFENEFGDEVGDRFSLGGLHGEGPNGNCLIENGLIGNGRGGGGLGGDVGGKNGLGGVWAEHGSAGDGYAGDDLGGRPLRLGTVVGLRAVGEHPGVAQLAWMAGESLARAGVALLSGGAAGCDSQAAAGARAAGGMAIELLPMGLIAAGPAKDGVIRWSLCPPRMGFSTAAAMERNLLLYAGGSASLIIAANFKSGGTWIGATQALRQRIGALFTLDAAAHPALRPAACALWALGAGRLRDASLFGHLIVAGAGASSFAAVGGALIGAGDAGGWRGVAKNWVEVGAGSAQAADFGPREPVSAGRTSQKRDSRPDRGSLETAHAREAAMRAAVDPPGFATPARALPSLFGEGSGFDAPARGAANRAASP